VSHQYLIPSLAAGDLWSPTAESLELAESLKFKLPVKLDISVDLDISDLLSAVCAALL
jgi:hypothetical protein